MKTGEHKCTCPLVAWRKDRNCLGVTGRDGPASERTEQMLRGWARALSRKAAHCRHKEDDGAITDLTQEPTCECRPIRLGRGEQSALPRSWQEQEISRCGTISVTPVTLGKPQDVLLRLQSSSYRCSATYHQVGFTHLLHRRLTYDLFTIQIGID